MLADRLSHVGLPFAEEWLNPYYMSRQRLRYGLGESVSTIELMQDIVARESRDGWFTIKVMWDFLDAFCERVRAENPEFKDLARFEIINRFFPNPHYVFLDRNRRVPQAISLLKAEQTGIWRSDAAHDEPVENRLHFSFLEVANSIQALNEMDKAWRLYFGWAQVEPLRLFYEKLHKQPQRTVQRVLKQIGFVPTTTECAVSGPRIQRLSDGTNAAWQQRYDATLNSCRSEANRGAVFAVGPASRLWQWEPEQAYLSTDIGNPLKVRIRVTHRGVAPWPACGWEDGALWLCLQAKLVDEAGRPVDGFYGYLEPGRQFRMEVGAALQPGDSAFVDLLLPSPLVRGKYRLVCALHQQSLGEPFQLVGGEPQCVLEWDWPAPRRAARAFWPDIADLLTNWQYLPWLGYFYDDKFPWLYHADHEWWFVDVSSDPAGPCRVFDAVIGWLEFTPASYPEVLRLKDGQRLRFARRMGDEREFIELASGLTVQFPTVKPHLIPKPQSGS
jgi:trehalose 2-sulfotransferase